MANTVFTGENMLWIVTDFKFMFCFFFFIFDISNGHHTLTSHSILAIQFSSQTHLNISTEKCNANNDSEWSPFTIVRFRWVMCLGCKIYCAAANHKCPHILWSTEAEKWFCFCRSRFHEKNESMDFAMPRTESKITAFYYILLIDCLIGHKCLIKIKHERGKCRKCIFI